MKIKTLIGISVLITLLVFSIADASAFKFLCLKKGQSIPSSVNPVFTCSSPICQICVYDDYYPAAPYKCNNLNGGCEAFGGESGIDRSPPVITLRESAASRVYNSKSIFVDLGVNEVSDIYYSANLSKGTWSKICNKCLGYSGKKTFRDGTNLAGFRAIDSEGNIGQMNVSFVIDSKKPVIQKTAPSNNNFANGLFLVSYSEENPKTVILSYGNNLTGQQDVHLVGCIGGKKQNCGTSVSLSSYDGQEINYWFNITDIAENSVKSRVGKLKVDITNPEIISFSHDLMKGYLIFNMSIVEKNFFKVEYMDNNDLRPMWKTICSSLKLENCFKKIYLRTGEHDLDIRVSDKAGNYAFKQISFTI